MGSVRTLTVVIHPKFVLLLKEMHVSRVVKDTYRQPEEWRTEKLSLAKEVILGGKKNPTSLNSWI